MKITAYCSDKFNKTVVHYTDRILGMAEPDQLTDEDRKDVRNGMTPLLTFVPRDNRIGETDDDGKVIISQCIAIPVEFIISIEDETSDKTSN